MSEGRARLEWEQTSHVLAFIVNAHGTKGGVKPRDFNPFQRKRPARVIATRDDMKALFLERRTPSKEIRK